MGVPESGGRAAGVWACQYNASSGRASILVSGDMILRALKGGSKALNGTDDPLGNGSCLNQ